MSEPEKSVKIAVVGDVHEQWEAADGEALQRLGVDLVLFVGDFGNESVDLVRSIAALDIPKAVTLGNHDAWWTATPWGREKCPAELRNTDRVQAQLDLLGSSHVGFGKLDFPQFGLTVVGGRPFSWGGSEWKYGDFYQERYGVSSFAESTRRIVAAVESAATDVVIFLGHNGPKGLGDLPSDPCGKDWKPVGGDFGDPDFSGAIAHSQRLGKAIPLVAFGHMHHHLRYTKEHLRKSFHLDESGTLYLNAARVPRIVDTSLGDRHRNFSIVTLKGSTVETASLVWVDRSFQTISVEILYHRPAQPLAQSA